MNLSSAMKMQHFSMALSTTSLLLILAALTTSQFLPTQRLPADPSIDPNCIWTATLPDPNIPDQGTTCSSVASTWNISLANFTAWNPIVNSASDYCSNLPQNTSYCIQTKGCHCGLLGGPVDASASRDCTFYTFAYPGFSPGWGDDIKTECDRILSTFNITEEQFRRLNPSVGPDCENFEPRIAYCAEENWEPFGPPDYTVIGSEPLPIDNSTSGDSPPGESMDGPLDPSTAKNCVFAMEWPSVLDMGDTCASIAEFNEISESEFIEWNPIVGEECDNLIPGNQYCVEIEGNLAEDSIETTSSSTATPVPSATESSSEPMEEASDVSEESATASSSSSGVTSKELSWTSLLLVLSMFTLM